MKKFANNFWPVFVLTAIVFVCFQRTLGSYFVADDFGQVAYASGICKGNWNALLSNFTGNYMQIPVMKIYRPCLLLSFVFDYALWHTRAFGYFLTNILFLIAGAGMLYFLLRELTKSWSKKTSILFSLLSAALFASNPLHCESISFVSGRDNVISAFFYLLTLWCFTRKGNSKSKKLLITGIVSFWVAMLSKETAIGLPAMLTGIVFFLPGIFQSDADTYSVKQRFQLAIKHSFPIWISTAIYFIVRYLALGTFFGGYTGDIGAGLMANSIARWESIDTLFRIIYPLNAGIFGVLISYFIVLLSILYAVLITVSLIRLLSGKYSARLLGLLSLWIFTAIVPIYQLWGLGQNLEGARFFFFLSIPLAIILPLLVLAPSDKVGSTIVEQKMAALGTGVMIILIVLGIYITHNNNIAWAHAGKQSKACMQESQRLARSTVAGKKVAIIGLPKEQDGAHVIYNGSTFNVMMSAPFSAEDYTDKFITFDPLFYSAPGLINAQRLRTVLCDPDTAGLFAWNYQTLTFDRLQLPSHETLTRTQSNVPIIFRHIDTPVAAVTSNQGILYHIDHQIQVKDRGLFLAPSNFDPYQYDFLELTLKTTFPKEMMFVYWRGSAPNSLDYCDAQNPIQSFVCGATVPTKIRIRLSNRWHWYTQGKIVRLQLEFLPGQSVDVTDMKLVCDRELAPTIAITNAHPSNIGVYPVNQKGVWLNYNANTIKQCTAVKIEISKPNYFFEGLSPDDDKTAVMKTIIEPINKGRMLVTNKLFLSPAHYQLRAICLDRTGQPIGEKSDPVTVETLN